jgi:nicotinamidase-related amidase
MSHIPAQPYEFPLPETTGIALLIIDMQRDFLEPGGFGEALGNDVSRLQAIVPTVKKLQETFRHLGLPIFKPLKGTAPT